MIRPEVEQIGRAIEDLSDLEQLMLIVQYLARVQPGGWQRLRAACLREDAVGQWDAVVVALDQAGADCRAMLEAASTRIQADVEATIARVLAEG